MSHKRVTGYSDCILKGNDMFRFKKTQKVDIQEEINKILLMMTMDDYDKVLIEKTCISGPDYQRIWFNVGDIITKSVSANCNELGLSNSKFAYDEIKKAQNKANRIIDILYDIKW